MAAVPDRAHGVDDVRRRQPLAGDDDGFARGQPGFVFKSGAQQATFFQNGRAAGAVDGAIDAAPTRQAGVGGVHNGRDLLPGHVALHELNTGGSVGVHGGQRNVG